MKTVKTGLFSRKYFFSLAEDEIFINNGYCLEVTKRTIKL